jgi:predicted TIM-barrel fold metal-dependent hydrolase
MVVDFHTHCWPDELAEHALRTLREHMPEATVHGDGTLRGLVAEMDAAGVDRAVALPVATKPSQVRTINHAAAQNRSERIIAFGALHPLVDNAAAEVAYLAANGVKGVKLHPEYQDFYVDDPALDRLYGPLQEAGLVVVFHAGWDPGPFTCDHAPPTAIRRVHERYPAMKIVAAHMGGFMMWEEVRRELAGLPVWLDTSAAADHLGADTFRELVRMHGSGRLLFASDAPWFDMAAARSWVEGIGLGGPETAAILGGNAAQLLAL